jgi:polo-like kinase 1
MTRLPYLLEWFRTRNAIVFMLNDGTVQINFFQDHTKMILCPLMNAVTYINEKREFRTYRVSLLESLGSSKELNSRLRYGCEILERIYNKTADSAPMNGMLAGMRA